jgi:uncharacterized membrane protein
VTHDPWLAVAIAVLAAGTFVLRLAGPVLRRRLSLTPRTGTLVDRAVAIVFAALVATSTVIEGHSFSGAARPAGVAVAGLLAWRRAPFVIVVLAAAVTTAGLRLLGVP